MCVGTNKTTLSVVVKAFGCSSTAFPLDSIYKVQSSCIALAAAFAFYSKANITSHLFFSNHIYLFIFIWVIFSHPICVYTATEKVNWISLPSQ